MGLVVVVALLLAGGLLWRSRATRRLTMEESVARYRRTLSAVHDATSRSRGADAPGRIEAPTSRGIGTTPGSSRAWPPPLEPRRRLTALTILALVTVAAIALVIAAGHSHKPRRAATPTTTRPKVTAPTTTTRPAPTTTVAALVTPTGTTGTAFTVAKTGYTLVVQASSGACWVDARDASGTALFSGTLSAGQSQSMTAGTLTLQLGNPAAVTLTIDGTPVPITLAGGSPVTIHFTAPAT